MVPKKRSLVDRLNSLPQWARDYIMDIETESDPAGTQRRLVEQQDLIRELTAKIAELEGVQFRPSEFEINGRGPGGPSKMRTRNGND